MSRRARRTGAIPTTYKGVRFRSRLEAKWACLFDSLGFAWEYEPDVQLSDYIPDYVVTPRGTTMTILVECKPFVTLTARDVAPAQRQIARSGWDGYAAIVGARLFPGSVVGWFAAVSPTRKPKWTEAQIALAGDVWTLGPIFTPTLEEDPLLLVAWRGATNASQWRAPRSA